MRSWIWPLIRRKRRSGIPERFSFTRPIFRRIPCSSSIRIMTGSARHSLFMKNSANSEREGKAKQKKARQRKVKPKADYLDNILHSKNLMLTTQIAKDYGMSAVRFNHLLADLGIQYKVREQWVLYAPYQGLGYTASKAFEVPQSDGSLIVRYQTEWTQKGRRFLYLFLKEKGYIPVVEQQLMNMGRPAAATT